MLTNYLSRTFFSAKKTVLYDLHLAHKGKMVEFAGYSMPVQYSQGILKEHEHCRNKASLFDVSHMGQFILTGADRLRLLQRTTVGNTNRKQKGGINECYLTLFLNEEAGIIDDAIACVEEDLNQVRVVANAGNKYLVLDHFKKTAQKQNLDVKINLIDDLGLIALQGPASPQVLQKFANNFDLAEAPFMSSFRTNVAGQQLIISRSGYTGEDGFQISGTGEQINRLTQTLLKDEAVNLAGLGARDSLRIQAGLCLHGHEMSQTITPFEAGLMWTVHKRQPNDGREHFIGQTELRKIVEDAKSGLKKWRKRAGFVLDGSGIVRENCRVYNNEDQEVGIVSSGTYSPLSKKCIGMAYVNDGLNKADTKLYAVQRDKKHPLTITKMPFVKPGYYKNWASFAG